MVALVLALLVLGPQRLVKFARSTGKWVRQMRNMTGDLTKTLTDAVSGEEEESDKESPDKKKMTPLQKISNEIKQALTLEDEKPAKTSSKSDEEDADSTSESADKTGEEIGQTLRKMRDEIGEALGKKDSSAGRGPSETNE